MLPSDLALPELLPTPVGALDHAGIHNFKALADITRF